MHASTRRGIPDSLRLSANTNGRVRLWPFEPKNEFPFHPDQEELLRLKSTLPALLALLLFSSPALAARRCSPFTVAGSYVRQTSPYMDQLTLAIDGTVYSFSSAAFDLILLGTFNPGVGSWTCLDDGTVLVTTIRSEYLQNSPSGDVPQPGQPLDINISVNLRVTSKFSILDGDRLRETHRIVTRVPLTDDPFGPGTRGGSSCMPSGKLCDPAPFRKIKPQPADIP